VKTLAEHDALAKAAAESNVLVMIEVHKRFDPIYVDAVDKIRGYGDFNFMNAYVSVESRRSLLPLTAAAHCWDDLLVFQ
jgi:predicted dehydrogenase